MSGTCSCAQHVKKLNQQISVMRKEIKNLRLLIDSAVRTHRKHVVSLQSVFRNSDHQEVNSHTNPGQDEGVGKEILLEQGIIQTVPIGHISSCFTAKNGTPRQPSVCGQSRATLQIESTVFNNPHHALIGLDHYSHVWIIFIFHKNGHLSSKAKVKPPRLNGQRVGVYSTRSPHRPNALGLTLAKLEHITGDTLHLSGIDMITGTPVLDIKPYIPEYDSPYSRTDFSATVCPEAGGSLSVSHTGGCMVLEEGPASASNTRPGLLKEKSTAHVLSTGDPDSHVPQVDDVTTVLGEIKSYIRQSNIFTQRTGEENAPLTDCTRAEPCESQRAEPKTEVCYDEASFSQVASWIREPPVTSLCVRFTPNAERDLDQFLPPGKTVPGRPSFRFLQGPEDAAAAIGGVLRADPRSVYRRTCCPDRLFYFTLDSAHITCWFGSDFAEVVQVRSAEPTATGPAD